MATTRFTTRRGRVRLTRTEPARAPATPPIKAPDPRRIARNFALMCGAEVACRGTSVVVTLTLAQRLGKAGYGRIEFAFNVVFWLVLIVRDGFEGIASRELARHPRLVRPLVGHLIAVKLGLALALYAGLMVVAGATVSGPAERSLLAVYGLMLLTTAVGLDYVFRGLERVGIVAASLCLRTGLYAAGVWLWVGDATRIAWVPVMLVAGEAAGIALVWAGFVRRHGWPTPTPGLRFMKVFLRRGRHVLLIQVGQTVLGMIDLTVVGLLCSYETIGLFGAPHRMVTAVLTFGLIFQQVAFPSLARAWRGRPEAGRKALDGLVRVLALVLLPLAIGATVMAGPIVRLLFPAEYASAGLLLAIGVWRAPLLTLASLYQAALIALNREAAGVRMLLVAALASGPLVAVMLALFGLPGAAAATGLTGLGLVLARYDCLAKVGRQPAWHHHLARPLAASAVMVLVCLAMRVAHPIAAVGAGAIAYVASLAALGGLKRSDFAAVLGRG